MKLLLTLAIALAFNSTAHAQLETIEVTVSEDFVVETITCTSWLIQYDYTQYGQVNGNGCASTGPLTPFPPSTQGHINVSISYAAGGKFVASGCRIDSTYSIYGYHHHALNCTY